MLQSLWAKMVFDHLLNGHTQENGLKKALLRSAFDCNSTRSSIWCMLKILDDAQDDVWIGGHARRGEVVRDVVRLDELSAHPF